MDDMVQLLQSALALVNDRKWWVLMALVIGFVIRTLKPDVLWVKWNVAARWRPVLAALLGVGAGICSKIVSGESWRASLTWGVTAGLAAILGHVFIVDAARAGRDVPMVGSGPPAK